MSGQGTPSMVNVDDFYEEFIKDNTKEEEIIAQAATELEAKGLDQLKRRISNKKAKTARIAAASVMAKDVPIPITPTTPGVPRISEVTERALELLWVEIEGLDVTSLIDEQVIKDFEYKGFNANELLRTILKKGIADGRDQKDLSQDLVNMVTIAVIKGSITDKNIEKMSEEGKSSYKKLEGRYGLQKGGSQGKTSEHITIARVAAALPGIVLQVLKAKPSLAKKFVGPFKTTGLPYYLRHQAAAACIPAALPERTKNFLLGLITAYTSDQSKALSKTKDSSSELYERQLQFVTTTFGSEHPTEASRVKLFTEFSIETDYEKLSAIGNIIKKSVEGFEVPSQSQIKDDLNKI